MKLRGIAATRHSVFRYALLGLMLLCVTLCIASCSSSEPMSAKIKKLLRIFLLSKTSVRQMPFLSHAMETKLSLGLKDLQPRRANTCRSALM